MKLNEPATPLVFKILKLVADILPPTTPADPFPGGPDVATTETNNAGLEKAGFCNFVWKLIVAPVVPLPVPHIINKPPGSHVPPVVVITGGTLDSWTGVPLLSKNKHETACATLEYRTQLAPVNPGEAARLLNVT